MFNIHKFAAKVLLAVSLLGGAGVAAAGPTYQVTLDTSAFGGTSGYVDFSFLAPNGAVGASATVSNFSGALGATSDVLGAVSGALPGTLVFLNADGTNDLLQGVDFGGLFHFDLTFGGDFVDTAGLDGSVFGVGLLDAGLDAYLGAPGNIVEFSLMPGNGASASSVTYALGGELAQVAVVPEPADWLSMATGLALVGWVARRRKTGAVR
jgi:hypothetical protein